MTRSGSWRPACADPGLMQCRRHLQSGVAGSGPLSLQGSCSAMWPEAPLNFTISPAPGPASMVPCMLLSQPGFHASC